MGTVSDQERQVRRAVILMSMRQGDMEVPKRLAVEQKLRELPDDIHREAAARLRGHSEAPALDEEGAALPSPEEVAAQVEAEVAEVMSGLAPGNLGSLAAELGISEEELAELVSELPDNFGQMVADEVHAQLASGS